jgi:predicted secreted hydrolase
MVPRCYWSREHTDVRRALLLALALTVLAAGAAVAARGERGDGVRVARATTADDVAHPGSRTEWWYVHAVDPATGRVVVVTFFSAPIPIASGFLFTDRAMMDWIAPTGARTHAGPGVATAAGSVRWDAQRGAWQVEQEAEGYRVRLTLTQPVAGLTAGPLRFGDEWMSWTVPAATARADGEVVTPSGERIVVDGWRGYHDHNWGAFELQSDAYDGWEWAVVHEPGGRALLLGGIVGRDDRFRGVLGRFGSGQGRWCRPSLERTHWTQDEGFSYPRVLEAQCADDDAVFTVTRPYVARLQSHALTESVGRSDEPGSLGLIEHLARLGP